MELYYVSQHTWNKKRHRVCSKPFGFPDQVSPDDTYFLELLFSPDVPCGVHCAAAGSKAK